MNTACQLSQSMGVKLNQLSRPLRQTSLPSLCRRSASSLNSQKCKSKLAPLPPTAPPLSSVATDSLPPRASISPRGSPIISTNLSWSSSSSPPSPPSSSSAPSPPLYLSSASSLISLTPRSPKSTSPKSPSPRSRQFPLSPDRPSLSAQLAGSLFPPLFPPRFPWKNYLKSAAGNC